MSKKAKGKAAGNAAQVADGHGPLGPWRLSLAVLVTGLTTGLGLYRAALTGVDLDFALGRSFAVAFLTWIVLGSINKMLAIAEAREAAADEVTSIAADDELDPVAP